MTNNVKWAGERSPWRLAVGSSEMTWRPISSLRLTHNLLIWFDFRHGNFTVITMNNGFWVITGTEKFDRHLTHPPWRATLVGCSTMHHFQTVYISACTAWHHSTSLSFACQSRTLLVAANSALQAEDFYTFLVITWQTTANVHFRMPALKPGTYFLKICRSQHL